MILVEQFSVGSSSSVSIATLGCFTVLQPRTDSKQPPSPPALEMVLALSGNELPSFGSNDVLVSEVLLHNPLDDQAVLEFTTSCKAEMWVVDDLGNVVFDSRDETNCLDIELEMALDSDETERFTLPQWNFFTADGCMAEPGVYTVVAELPELGMSATQRLDFHPGEANPCASVQSASLAATLSNGRATIPSCASRRPFPALSLTTCEWLNRVRSKLNSLMNSKPLSTCSRPFAMLTTVGKSCFPVIQNRCNLMRLTFGWFRTERPFSPTVSTPCASLFCPRPPLPPRCRLHGRPITRMKRRRIRRPWRTRHLRTGQYVGGLLTDQGTCHVMESDGSTYLYPTPERSPRGDRVPWSKGSTSFRTLKRPRLFGLSRSVRGSP